MIQTGLNINDINALRDRLIEGMEICVPVGKAKLLKKYRNFASTDKGNWKWVEVYLAENGTRCVDWEKMVKEIPKNANVNI